MHSLLISCISIHITILLGISAQYIGFWLLTNCTGLHSFVLANKAMASLLYYYKLIHTSNTYYKTNFSVLAIYSKHFLCIASKYIPTVTVFYTSLSAAVTWMTDKEYKLSSLSPHE